MDGDHTALVVLVPEADPSVATYRQRYDPSAAEGMTAHITILYPFLAAGQVGNDILDSLRSAFAVHRRFSFTLSQLKMFPGVLYLAPEPDQPFIALSKTVSERFPECPLFGGLDREIIPHLTIANVGDQRMAEGIAQEFRRTHPGGVLIRTDVKVVSLAVRRAGQWRESVRFELAEGEGSRS